MKSTTVTIGTKPMAAILAAWKADATKHGATTAPTGDGWLKAGEIMPALGMGRDRAAKYIRNGIKEGRIEVFNGSAFNAAGRGHPQVWYRLKG